MANLAFSSLGVLLPGMQAELGFGTIEAGWLGSARSVGQFLMFPASIILVRFAPNRTYGLFLLLVGFATVLAGLAPGFWLVLATQVVFSVGFSLAQVPANLVRFQWIPPKEFATVFGIAMALNAVSQSAGLVVIPLVLGFLGGWRSIFLGAGVLLIAIVGLWSLTARERITDRYHEAQAAERGLTTVKRALRRKEFYLLGIATLGGVTAYSTSVLFLPLYLVEDRGLSLAAAGSITAMLPAAGLISSLSAGFLSDRIGRRKPLIWPIGLILPPLYLLLLSPLPAWALAGVAFVLGYFAWMPFPSLGTMPYELPGIRPAEIAIGQSLILTISTLGVLGGPIVVSTIAAATGSFQLGILSISLLPVLFALGSIGLPDTGPKAHVKPA